MNLMVPTNQIPMMDKQKREMNPNIILKIVIRHKGREQKKTRGTEKRKKTKQTRKQ